MGVKMTETSESISKSRISRRTALKVGVGVAGTVWVAPTIESFLTPAAAASAPSGTGLGLSYVIVQLFDGTTYYRVKFSNGSHGSTSLSCGPNPAAGDCFSVDPTDTLPSTASAEFTISSSCPGSTLSNPQGVVTGSFSTSTGLTITNSSSSTTYTVTTWILHQGQCCAVPGAPAKDVYAGPTSTSLGPNGGTVTFPNAPNRC